ncbi:MAG: ABC transporter ATP-binding protein [Fibrobacterota bacterium]
MVLTVQNLSKYFALSRSLITGRVQEEIRAVHDVSFSMGENEVLGVVGESGCGKSTLARTILRLLAPTAGRVFLRGEEVTAMKRTDLRKARRHMQIIFQDALSSLNPRIPVIKSVEEPLRIHTRDSAGAIRKRALRLLQRTGIAADQMQRLPHQFSGGQCQRIAIARALALDPALIIADEAVSALDVSVQAQILNLLREIREEKKISLLFISHDLAVINHISDRVMVMYLGEVVEEGTRRDLISNPCHPYTQALIAAAPDIAGQRAPLELRNDILPSPSDPPRGCTFHPRCPRAENLCTRTAPVMEEKSCGRRVRCHLVS